MIPVSPKPEPASFDKLVRIPGGKWLKKRHVRPSQSLPKSAPALWRKCSADLHSRYEGVCAYLCVYIERVVGGDTVDHFIPKSVRSDLSYEWSNFRLASSRINSRKRIVQLALDPFTIKRDTFYLDLVTGHIFPNPALNPQTRRYAQQTIDALKLDRDDCRKLRTKHFNGYIGREYNDSYLRKSSPFVWYEASRQGLLDR